MKSHSNSKGKPSSAYIYEQVHMLLYGEKAFVQAKYFPKFMALEKKLSEHGISARIFTYSVLKMLQKWLKQKGWKTFPINVFCGDWVFQKYMGVHKSETVLVHDFDEEYRELLYTELLVSRRYMELNLQNGVVHKFGEVVSELREILDPLWLSLYDSGKSRKQTLDVLEIFEEEYNVSASSLTKLLTELILKR